MLWGHCIQYSNTASFDFFSDKVFLFIYSFHMPLFMLVSGYLFYFSFRKRNLQELLQHRVSGLIHPIIIFTILDYYLSHAVHIIKEHDYGALFSGAWLENINILWFLWSTLIASVVIGIVYKSSDKPYVKLLLLLSGIGFALIMPCAVMNIWMLPYFLTGFLFCRWKENHAAHRILKVRYAFLIIFPVMLAFFHKEHLIYVTGFYDSNYSIAKCIWIDVYRWAIGFAGSIFILVLIEMMLHLGNQLSVMNRFLNCMDRIGSKSLQIYCVSILVLSRCWPFAARTALSRFSFVHQLTDNWIVYDFLFTPLIAVFFTVAILLLLKVIEKARINRFIFGR